METFVLPLYQLLLRDGMVSSATIPLYLPVFGAGCAVMALMVLFLDVCVFVVRGWSFLGYSHGTLRTVLAAVLMPAAAGIIGMMGLASTYYSQAGRHA